MAGYYFVVFDWNTARAPHGLESEKSLATHHTGLKTDLERRTSEELCQEAIKEAKGLHDGDVSTKELGSGNGFAFKHGVYCSYSHEEGAHVWFSGEVSKWPGLDLVKETHDAYVRDQSHGPINESAWLLKFYLGLCDVAALDYDAILDCMFNIEGRFAFVVFDERRKRVMSSRDADGAEPLYWGVTESGQLLFGTSSVDFDHCEPSATLFPSGTVYLSQGDTIAEHPGDKGWVILGSQWPGQLLSFVHDAAHSNHVCLEIGCVMAYRVASYQRDSEGHVEGSVVWIGVQNRIRQRFKEQGRELRCHFCSF